MRIWFIEIGEPLPVESGKRLLRYGMFTAWLATRGHDVTWWACDFSHAVKSHVAPLGEQALESGVRLVVLPGRGYARNISIARILHHRAFAATLAAALEAEKTKPDIIVCPIPTVENAGVIADYAARHNIPYVLDIRDHWPDDLANRFPRLTRPLAKLLMTPMYQTARKAARRAASISGVTRMQRDYGLQLAGRRADDMRDPVFYLGYIRQPVSSHAASEAQAWWQAQGLRPDAAVAAFTGTLGVSFDFAPVLAAAKRLYDAGRRDIQFVIAGDGGARAGLIAQAGAMAGDTVLFPGWIDQPKIDALLTRARVALAPYIPGTSMSLPNKFFEYMAYGLPVLSSCTGESEDLILRHQFGVQYSPQDTNAFHDALLRVVDEPATAKAMGAASLTLFEQQFDQSMLFTQMERHLSTLIKPA